MVTVTPRLNRVAVEMDPPNGPVTESEVGALVTVTTAGLLDALGLKLLSPA